jgi:hypothetical protein
MLRAQKEQQAIRCREMIVDSEAADAEAAVPGRPEAAHRGASGVRRLGDGPEPPSDPARATPIGWSVGGRLPIASGWTSREESGR